MAHSGGQRSRPTALKVLKGVRPGRLNKAEPKPPPGEVTPPYELHSDVQAVWENLVPLLRSMKVLRPPDAYALAILCELIVVQQRASRVLMRSAILVESEGHGGGLKRNPAAAIMRDAASMIRLYAQEFGLTPSARAAIRLAEGERDELDELLG